MQETDLDWQGVVTQEILATDHPRVTTLFTMMQSHPSHPSLAELITKHPKSAGALFQTYNDVTLAQKWTDIRVLELPKCRRGAIMGLRPSLTAGEPPSTSIVVPCGLAESLSTTWIRDAFDARQPACRRAGSALCSDLFRGLVDRVL